MIKFGVAGNSLSFYAEGNKHTYEAAKWCAKKGIDVFEYSFGKGVRMTESTARQIGNFFRLYNVDLSVHAPYYINFANPESNKINSSINYVFQSLTKLKEFNWGERVILHPATQGKLMRNEAVELTYKNLSLLAENVVQQGFSDKKICLETMGKLAQIGTVEEIINFCKIAPFYFPCIDFGHINARTMGGLKSSDDYRRIIDFMLDNLPFEKVNRMHIHFSKIMYGSAGEIKHLTFSDNIFGPEFFPLALVIKEYNLEPVIICESDGTQAEDAIFMKELFYGNTK